MKFTKKRLAFIRDVCGEPPEPPCADTLKKAIEMLIPKQTHWIGFDLDDTLHYFRKASGAAAEAVFSYINDGLGASREALRESYKVILQQGQSGNFAEDRPSREYRTERFGKLLDEYSILSPRHLEDILAVYDNALCKNLTLTTGAKEALVAAKKKGFGIFILSEGPYDAQETTIQRLGIEQYVDVLMTSSREKLSKSDGLFTRALTRIGAHASETVYVGDSLERDIVPARSIGITAIHLSSVARHDVVSIPELSVLADAITHCRPLEKKET